MADIRKVSDLQPDKRNANKGTERGLKALDHSLRQYGAGRSLLVDKHGRIIAGNKTAQAAADIGLDDVILVQTDGTKLVAVQRTDLDLEQDKAARELAYADNRVGQLDLDFDVSVILEDIAAGVNLDALWRSDELEALVAAASQEVAAAGEDKGAQVDRAEELSRVWGVQAGQLWEIPSKTVQGKAHRLLCGDSTKAEDVARLMGNTTAALMATDPPYNVDVDYGSGVDDSKSLSDYERFSREWLRLWQAVSVRQIVTPGGVNHAAWMRWFTPYHVGVWIKTNALTRGKVANSWCWEPVCFFGGQWPRRRANDVFDYPIGQQKDTANHPCPKPLKMWVDLLENYSELGDVIAEAFSGSGTTHVAAEQTARLCYGVELEPKYVGVILQRLADMGLGPRLIT